MVRMLGTPDYSYPPTYPADPMTWGDIGGRRPLPAEDRLNVASSLAGVIAELLEDECEGAAADLGAVALLLEHLALKVHAMSAARA
jgi:hypothetical protein